VVVAGASHVMCLPAPSGAGSCLPSALLRLASSHLLLPDYLVQYAYNSEERCV
jgi:hypothetical protein